jgi:NADPH-dependent 2,4-dienoyl-CoA reductase/sulfur reductase-like enzyme
MIAMDDRVVVIGGVAAGMSAAAKARRIDGSLKITVFERSPHVSYGACGLPYYVSGVIPSIESLIAYTPDYFSQHRGIDVKVRHEALSIDPSAKMVRILDITTGNEWDEPYDKLMLATGASPKRLPEQNQYENMFCLHSIEDGRKLRAALTSARDVAIIGGGFIAMELCESLRARGINTHVFQRSTHIMKSLDADMTIPIEDELARNGVTLHKNQQSIAFEGNDERVLRVVSDDGTFTVDAVIVAIGVSPNVELARKAGVAIGTSGAIRTSKRMETSVKDIYAGGDNTQGYSIVTGDPCYFPLGDTANKMGKIAGENMAGGTAYYGGCMGSAIVKIFDLAVARTGFTSSHAEMLGIEASQSVSRQKSRAHYYPGGTEIYTKLIVNNEDDTIIGGQMVGREGVAGRINVLAAAISQRMTPEDLYHVDMCYSPPYSPVWDPLLIAANVARKTRDRTEPTREGKKNVLSF